MACHLHIQCMYISSCTYTLSSSQHAPVLHGLFHKFLYPLKVGTCAGAFSKRRVHTEHWRVFVRLQP
jgi:hypothetical protein